MDAGQALRVLGTDDPDEAEDLLEEELFELRKFVLAGPVLLKTFQSRMKKARQMNEARDVLFGKSGSAAKIQISFSPASSFVETWLGYNAEKNRLKQLVSSASGYASMEAAINAMVELERALAALFAGYDDWTPEEALVSREPDPMYFLEWLRNATAERMNSIDELYSGRDKLDPGLAKALKRLSLLTKYLYE
jgi:hypothetical protein